MAVLPWGLLTLFWVCCGILLVIPLLFEVFYKRVIATGQDLHAGRIYKAKPLDIHRKCRKFIDKRYLVVGGTKGIGRAIAISLAEVGAAVDIVGRTNGSEVLQVLSARSPATPNKKISMFRFHKADVSTTHGCAEFIERLEPVIPAFDGLVLTVGVWPDSSNSRTSEGYDRVVFTDVIARALVFQHLLDARLLSNRAVVVNVLGSGLLVPYFLSRDLKRFKQPFSKMPEDYESSLSNILVCTSAADAWLKEAAKRNSRMTFIGTMPGFVWTEVMVPTLGKCLSNFLMFCGELFRIVWIPESVASNHLSIIEYAMDVKRLNLSYWDHYLVARVANKIAGNNSYSEWLWETLENIKAGTSA